MYGEIASHWRREGGEIVLDVTIPPKTTASVYASAQAPVEVGSGRDTFTLTQ
jgi:hypothetical protein